MSVRVVGDKELDRAMKRMGEVAERAIQTEALRQAAKPVAETAPQPLPYGPGRGGHLRDTIRIKALREERVPTVAVYPAKFTGLFLARGWKTARGGVRVPPPYNAFLERAFDQRREDSHHGYSAAATRELDKRWRR